MRGCERPAASREVAALVARVLDDGAPLDEAEITRLFRTRGADLEVLIAFLVLAFSSQIRGHTCWIKWLRDHAPFPHPRRQSP